MSLTYRSTKAACYLGYVTQAISINFAPLLYVTFQKKYALTLSQIGTFIAVNFAVQMLMDILAGKFSEKMNIRFFTIFANAMIASGLIGLSVLPEWLPPFAGLLTAAMLLGIGGGLSEVMVSPLMEAIPSDGKAGNMSLLHSFYCWGQAGVVFFSGIFFHFFAVEDSFHFLPFLWAVFPAVAACFFAVVPMYRLPEDPNASAAESRRQLLRSPVFYAYIVMMLCGGAAEMVMAQWASTYAEEALHLSKSVGDLLGPCMFAVAMGSVRALYGAFSKRIRIEKFMKICCVTCTVGYLLTAFAADPAVSLSGVAICGLSVAVLWPGLLSMAAEKIPFGGISMFALLALAGDVGCLLGPYLIGLLFEQFGNLRYGFLTAILFPVFYAVVLILLEKGIIHGKDRVE